MNLEEELKDELKGVNVPKPDSQVQEALAKLREGTKEGLSPRDHYDLGVAYMNMGLVDDAVREFNRAKEDGDDGEAAAVPWPRPALRRRAPAKKGSVLPKKAPLRRSPRRRRAAPEGRRQEGRRCREEGSRQPPKKPAARRRPLKKPAAKNAPRREGKKR